VSSTDASSEKSQRLFVAVDVPEHVRALVERAIGRLRERHPGGRWVPAANQHVTVRFLGATPPARVPLVLEAVARTASRHRAFAIRTTSLGAFPSPRRARVLWVGLDDGGGHARALAADLDAALAPVLEPEVRAFTPHLTVARFDPPVRLDAVIADVRCASDPFEVGALTLYRSHLGRGAPRYEPLATVPLAGDGAGDDAGDREGR
jgi:RNA 2',3'-cyclic 3'-phosphodiesterase